MYRRFKLETIDGCANRLLRNFLILFKSISEKLGKKGSHVFNDNICNETASIEVKRFQVVTGGFIGGN
jgi:hypothetical protein